MPRAIWNDQVIAETPSSQADYEKKKFSLQGLCPAEYCRYCYSISIENR